jgi:hypothetical protein
MSKRIKATINPALLIWARTTAGYELVGAAEALDLSQEKLEAWEGGEDQPSIHQLPKLAELYKRPLAVLYLPEPPQTFQPMHDFRRLADAGPRQFRLASHWTYVARSSGGFWRWRCWRSSGRSLQFSSCVPP